MKKSMNDCLFCKISKKETPADVVFENGEVVAFKDINPKARVHLLFVLKKHIDSVAVLEDSDEELVGKLIFAARDMAKKENLSGYKLVFNVGRTGGQIIDHIHLHLLAD